MADDEKVTKLGGAVYTVVKNQIDAILKQQFMSTNAVDTMVNAMRTAAANEPAVAPDLDLKTEFEAGRYKLQLNTHRLSRPVAKLPYESILWDMTRGPRDSIEEGSWLWRDEQQARVAHMAIASELRNGRDPTLLEPQEIIRLVEQLDAQFCVPIPTNFERAVFDPTKFDVAASEELTWLASSLGIARMGAESDDALRERCRYVMTERLQRGLVSVPLYVNVMSTPQQPMQYIGPADVYINGQKVEGFALPGKKK